MSHYIAYYDEQSGGGRNGGLFTVYAGSPYQRGSGIGSFVGAIFRHILPYLTKGAKAVGKEALRTGLNVLDDVSNTGATFAESFNARAKESRKNLQRKAVDKIRNMMEGKGYKEAVKKRMRQLRKRRAAKRRRLGRKKKVIKKHKNSQKNRVQKKKKKKSKKKRARDIRDIRDIFGPQ